MNAMERRLELEATRLQIDALRRDLGMCMPACDTGPYVAQSDFRLRHIGRATPAGHIGNGHTGNGHIGRPHRSATSVTATWVGHMGRPHGSATSEYRSIAHSGEFASWPREPQSEPKPEQSEPEPETETSAAERIKSI